MNIGVGFYIYRQESIKADTESDASKTTRPMCCITEGHDISLPFSWSNFLALQENKADLAKFLSEQLIANDSNGCCIGVSDEQKLLSSHISTNIHTTCAAWLQ